MSPVPGDAFGEDIWSQKKRGGIAKIGAGA